MEIDQIGSIQRRVEGMDSRLQELRRLVDEFAERVRFAEERERIAHLAVQEAERRMREAQLREQVALRELHSSGTAYNILVEVRDSRSEWDGTYWRATELIRGLSFALAIAELRAARREGAT